MPGKIKVKVLAGRNLPVMDRASDTTDAFVEIKFGGVTHKTDVCRKSLNPHWNSTEWYRFEVEESELQDEPLQLRLMDHDTYSANDAIGKVVISLAPLLAREANNVKGTGNPGGAVLSGWIPVFDTMHGIRGELNVIVKVELLSDFNKYKTSSCGVQFFHCPMIPPGYRATSIHGFVEELVVNDDPEYQWIDKIRTPRASNEARQVAFIKLSNQVQRLVGLKAAELGANAVVGYQQDFDLEGEAGVVARAIGTAVSITPLPTPYQPINITCTQQQLKKCLDILATDDDSVTDLSQYYSTHRDELQKMLSILNPKATSLMDDPEAGDDDDDGKLDRGRAASINSYAGSASIYQEEDIAHKSLRHLSEDQTDLNKLLNKNDSDSDSSGPIKKIKNLKKNFFTKKFTKRKSKKDDDSVSIKSNSSDTSKISIIDIKNEFGKLKRLKTPTFKKVSANKQDEGVGMASILARSVIHVHTSLACIAETQDSEQNSPSSTVRKTSESEHNINAEEETAKDNEGLVKTNTDNKTVPEIHFTSLKNIHSETNENDEPVRRISESCPTSPMVGRSENLLKLPGDVGYYGSVSSALSGDSSIYSSSEEEEYESSDKSDSEELETTASIVNSIMNHAVNPVIVAEMDRKLSSLQHSPPNLNDVRKAEEIKLISEEALSNIEVNVPVTTTTEIQPKEVQEYPEKVINTPSTSASPEKCVTKPNSHYIKIHNPFAHKKHSTSISAPSSPTEKRSFVGRSSKRIRDQLSKLTKNNMIKSLSHYSLLPKKKHEKSLSHNGSSSDVPSRVPSETVLGSHFLSYSDLLSLDKDGFQNNKLCKSDEFDRAKVSMYIGSEPVSRASFSGLSLLYHGRDDHDHHHHKKEKPLKSTGLIHTAMETILIDKVDTLLVPSSPEPNANTQFFNDVSEKLVEHKIREFDSKIKMGQVQTSTGSTTPRIVAVTPKRQSEDLTAVDNVVDRMFEVPEHKSVQSAMENNPYGVHFESHDHINEEHHDKHKYKLPKIDTNIKTSIKDRVHSMLTPDIHFENMFHRKHSKHDVKSGGLVHTAMQTMLMDRAQSMMPDSPEPIPIHADSKFENNEHIKKSSPKEKGVKESGLIHSAMETMLMDKIQAVMSDSSEPIPIHIDSQDNISHKSHNSRDIEVKPTGLIHSAMETMLMDKIQAVMPDSSEPIPIHIDSQDNVSHKSHNSRDIEVKPTGLIHSAMETMLMDKIQAVMSDSSEPIPIHIDSQDNISHKSHNSRDIEVKPTGLIHSAMETMLMDKIQAVMPDSSEPIPIHIDSQDNVSHKSHNSRDIEVKPTGLIHSAMETMLMDKIQAVMPDSSEPIPIHIDSQDNISHKSHNSRDIEVKPTGLIHSAMETMLMDKIQAVMPDSSEPIPIHIDSQDNISHKSHNSRDIEVKPTGLIHSAMETMLIDKVQNLISPETEVSPAVPSNDHDKVAVPETESKGLVHTAMETMLIEKAQALVNPDVVSLQESAIDNNEDKVIKHSPKVDGGDTQTLVQTAMETMLIDRMQTMYPRHDENVKMPFAKDKEGIELVDIQIPSSNNPNEVSKMTTKTDESIKPNKIQSKVSEPDNLKTTDKLLKDNTQSNESKSIDAFNDKNVNKNDLPKKAVTKEALSNSDSIKQKKLLRQNSIHSVAESKQSEESPNTAQPNVTRAPVLQYFHPILSGQLETIPSVSESSFDRSLDESFESNSVSVCDNSHAACGADRDRDRGEKDRGSPKHSRHESYGGKEPVGSAHAQNSSLNSTSTPMGIHRRSSDSDLSVTPKGGSLNTSAVNVGSGGGAILKPSMNSNNLDLLEYPFLTMKEYPSGFIVHIGGTVMSRAVRLVEAAGAPGVAWPDLRTELRAHARALRCNAVLAYEEKVAICDDVCVLSASGTAAVINLDCDFNADIDQAVSVSNPKTTDWEDACSIAHVPYSTGAGPYRAELSTCGGCRRVRVPAVLLATCDKPSRLAAYPKAVTLTAVAGRSRRAAGGGEAGARELSDQLPFLEYELHRLLLAKLRMQGANAIFSLQTQIAVGDRCVLALASGLACKLTALPPPTPPRIKASEKDKEALEIQRALWDTFVANKAANGYDAVIPESNAVSCCSSVEPPALDLAGDKDACVLELDEAEDVETARLLCVRKPPLTAWSPTLKAQRQPPLAFVQVSRCRLSLSSGGATAAERGVCRALDAVSYKLRRRAPTAVHTTLHLDLPEDEIQLVLSGTAIPLADPSKPEPAAAPQAGAGDADDDIFELDEEQLVSRNQLQDVVEKDTGQSPHAVAVTSLSAVAGGAGARRVCALRLLFVRETTAVREQGGLSGFLHTFTCEVMAILRAYTAALGGNALTSYYITQLMLQDNAHKNQGQCLLSVGGDVVHVTY